ncbi:MAG: hypothetical protein GY755_21900 [Chloroflexi bacterium]|nr:hypothetical protein [Chloroflexota bacterium]
MADFTRTWEASDKEYRLYDITSTKTSYGVFTKMIGGDMKIDTVAYNVIDPGYNVTTKFIPGQTSFAPFRLECEMSKVVIELYDWFMQAVAGTQTDLRKNCSIEQYKKGSNGPEPLITWNLLNTIPITLPGFSYHTYQKTESAKFKIMLQAESIEIVFP